MKNKDKNSLLSYFLFQEITSSLVNFDSFPTLLVEDNSIEPSAEATINTDIKESSNSKTSLDLEKKLCCLLCDINYICSIETSDIFTTVKAPLHTCIESNNPGS